MRAVSRRRADRWRMAGCTTTIHGILMHSCEQRGEQIETRGYTWRSGGLYGRRAGDGGS